MRLAGACQAGEHVLQCHALREPEGVKGGGDEEGGEGGAEGGEGVGIWWHCVSQLQTSSLTWQTACMTCNAGHTTTAQTD